jgi:hypothetical protein
MKTIGTDVSLSVCKKEGYLMLRFDARKKFSAEESYNVFGYYPDYAIRDSKGVIPKDSLILDTWVSWNALKEQYIKHKEGIDSFADDMPELMQSKPDYYSLLNAASTINSYCGIE